MTTEEPSLHHSANKPLSYGVFLPAFAEFAEPKRLVVLAKSAEHAGWDGLYLWDHMLTIPGMAVADPFIILLFAWFGSVVGSRTAPAAAPACCCRSKPRRVWRRERPYWLWSRETESKIEIPDEAQTMTPHAG